MKCKQCGSDIVEQNYTFCPICGAPIESATEILGAGTVQQPVPTAQFDAMVQSGATPQTAAQQQPMAQPAMQQPGMFAQQVPYGQSPQPQPVIQPQQASVPPVMSAAPAATGSPNGGKRPSKTLIIAVAAIVIALIIVGFVALSAQGGAGESSVSSASEQPSQSSDPGVSSSSGSTSSSSSSKSSSSTGTSSTGSPNGSAKLEYNAYADSSAMSSYSTKANVDVSGIDAVAESGSSDIFIDDVHIDKDGYKGSIDTSGAGSDKFALTLKNNGDKDVTEVTLYIIGYTDQHESIQVGGGINTINLNGLGSVGTDSHDADMVLGDVLALTTEDATIRAGSSEKVGFHCSASHFAGARLIVAAWTTSDGVEHENPAADRWLRALAAGA